jgi:hypothetical protein
MKTPILNSLLFLLFFQISIGQTNKIKIDYKINSDNSIDFSYTKNVPGSYTLYLTFPKLTNTYPTSFKDVIKYNTGKLVSLYPINKRKSISFSYNVSYIQGVINPKKIDENFIYALPFKTGSTLKIQELKYLGETYLNTSAPKNWKSYEFITSKDSVLSVRKGLVVKVINNYKETHNNFYTSKKNSVLVEQPDGSFAYYSNFKKNGIFVKEGQTIYPHMPIGVLPATKANANCYLYLGIYYLSNPNFNKRKSKNINNQQNLASYIIPKFLTDKGVVTLEPNTTYQVKFNEDLYIKEFSKKEKRKLKKGIKLYFF